MFVKICGIRTVAAASAAAAAGANAIGLNFHPASPRFVNDADAAAILRILPREVLAVAVAVSPPISLLRRLWWELEIRCIQLYETLPERLAEAAPPPGVRFIVAAGVQSAGDYVGLIGLAQRFVEQGLSVQAVLADAKVEGLHGGTGRTGSWDLLAGVDRPFPLLLAGGLTPENVTDAVRLVHPDGVDVASGVESAAGTKDLAKMAAFVSAARRADKEPGGGPGP